MLLRFWKTLFAIPVLFAPTFRDAATGKEHTDAEPPTTPGELYCSKIASILSIALVTSIAMCTGPLLLTAAADLTTNLAAFYPFNGNANDESGNSNNGQLQGAVPTMDRFGHAASAYSFLGGGAIGVPDNGSSLDISGDFTIALWLRVTGNTSGWVLNKHIGGNNGDGSWWLAFFGPGDGLHFQATPHFDSTAPTSSPIPSGTWVFVALTYRPATGAWAFYARPFGGSFSTTTGTVFLSIGNTGLPFLIGNRDDGIAPFPGDLDDIRIYKRVLTGDEINALSMLTPPPHVIDISPDSGPVGTTVTITGENFGDGQGSTVAFGSTQATVSSWSDTQIKVTVPSLSVGPHNVVVTITDSSNPVTFEIVSCGAIAIGAVQVSVEGPIIRATFQPKFGLTLVEAASVCDYDHFNWLQTVTVFPHSEDPGLLTPSGVRVPFRDPPVDYIRYPADNLPFYWNEEDDPFDLLFCIDAVTPPNRGSLFRSCHQGPFSQFFDPTFLEFVDRPQNPRLGDGEKMRFVTQLVGVNPHTGIDILNTFRWSSNYTGSQGAVQLETFSLPTGDEVAGRGGIFDLQLDVALEKLPLYVRLLLVEDGAQNVPVPACVPTVINKIEIEEDQFEVKGSFILDAHSDGIAPLNDDMMLRLTGGTGSFITIIPAGSFKQDKKGRFTFEGTINSVKLEAKITPLGGNQFEFKAEGEHANLHGIANPVTVTFTIGNECGETSVTVKFEKDHNDRDKDDHDDGDRDNDHRDKH